MGFHVSLGECTRFRVQASECRVYGAIWIIQGVFWGFDLGFAVEGLGCRIMDLRLNV